MTGLFQPGRTLIIAEVGSNHGGDAGLARESIAAAVEAGADVVKFQMYQAEKLVDDRMPVLKYIAQTHATQRERFKSLQLGEEVFADLAGRAKSAGIGFMVTPFFDEAVRFLDPYVPAFKIASGDLTNLSLLRAAVATGKPVIVSTGLSTPDEVDWVVRQVPAGQLHLLHCVGAYPTPDAQVNLRAIPALAHKYGVAVGYSDHSVGITACVSSVAMGATIVEKHFLPRDDSKVADTALSVGVADFRRMVDEIRRVEAMLGDGAKALQDDEVYFRTTLRRSVYAARDLAAGEALTLDAVISLRPFLPDAASPMDLDGLEGRRLKRPIAAGRPVMLADLEGDFRSQS